MSSADRSSEASRDRTLLERELEVLRRTQASLEKELDQSRDQLRVMSSEREELEVWRGELERRLAATTTELGMLRSAREEDQRDLKHLREALAEAESRADRSGRSMDSSHTLAAQAAEIELLMSEVASLRAQRAETRAREGAGEVDPGRGGGLAVAEVARLAEELQAALQDALGPAQALLDLARAENDVAGPDDRADEGSATAQADLELISRAAEQTAREQAERELRSAADD